VSENGSSSRVAVLNSQGPDPYARGMSLWLAPREARRLAVLARDAGCSLADVLERLIGDDFRRRF